MYAYPEDRITPQTEALADAYEQLAALYEITQVISSHLHLKTVLDTIARSTAELLGTDTGVILLLDEDEQTLHIRGAYGLSETVVQGTHDRVGESLAGRVVQQGKPIIANDLPNDARFVNPSAIDEGLLACASVPLHLGDKIIGTLDVHSKTNRWAFTESHIGILEMLAGQAAIAIENARLYERLQTAHSDLEFRIRQRTAELVAANEQLRHESAERQKMAEKLERERNLLKTLIDHLPDYIFVKDVNCRFILVKNLSENSAHPDSRHDNLIGKTDFDLFPKELAQKYYDDDQRVIKSGKAVINQEEPALDLVTGMKRWRMTSKIPFHDARGNIAGLVGISRDITEQKRTRETLEQRNQELLSINTMNTMLQTCRTEEETYKILSIVSEKLFPGDSGCVYLLDVEKTMLKMAVSWGQTLQFSPKILANVCAMLQRNQFYSLFSVDESLECACLPDNPDITVLCAPIRTPDELLGIFHMRFEQNNANNEWGDSLESKKMLATRMAGQYALFLANLRLREQLRLEAIRDPLTGLYNRRYMEASLEREAYRAARYQSRLGIIMLDIDHFKQFNDTYGHEAGDAVLRELGGLVLGRTRGEDIACRYGGEELLIILSGISLETARKRAEELWDAIRTLHVMHHGIPLSVTVSAGVATLAEHGPNVNDVVKAADKALYQAKSEGRDRVVVACPDKKGNHEIRGTCEER